jgi:uncharacterized membrane protein
MIVLFPAGLFAVSLLVAALLHPVRFFSAMLAIFFGLCTIMSGLFMLMNPQPEGITLMLAFGIPWVLVLWFRRRMYR